MATKKETKETKTTKKDTKKEVMDDLYIDNVLTMVNSNSLFNNKNIDLDKENTELDDEDIYVADKTYSFITNALVVLGEISFIAIVLLLLNKALEIKDFSYRQFFSYFIFGMIARDWLLIKKNHKK